MSTMPCCGTAHAKLTLLGADIDRHNGDIGGNVSGGDRAAAHEVRVLLLVNDADVVELDVQVLVDRVQRALDRQVVLELDRDLPQQRAWRSRQV